MILAYLKPPSILDIKAWFNNRKMTKATIHWDN